jgi:hypothetical protein
MAFNSRLSTTPGVFDHRLNRLRPLLAYQPLDLIDNLAPRGVSAEKKPATPTVMTRSGAIEKTV